MPAGLCVCVCVCVGGGGGGAQFTLYFFIREDVFLCEALGLPSVAPYLLPPEKAENKPNHYSDQNNLKQT